MYSTRAHSETHVRCCISHLRVGVGHVRNTYMFDFLRVYVYVCVCLYKRCENEYRRIKSVDENATKKLNYRRIYPDTWEIIYLKYAIYT